MGSVSKLIKKSPTGLQKLYYNIVPFSYRYGKDFRKVHNLISKSQWWDIDKLYSYRAEELNRLLEHAYKNVPYYQRIFDERGLKPKDIQNVSDLCQLPILTKDIIQKNLKDLVSKNAPEPLIKFSTSGTTGNPLIFFGTDYMYKAEAAFITRSFDAHNSKLYGEKTIWLRRYVPDGGMPIFKYDNELTRLYLSAYHLSKASIGKYINLINNYKGTTLVGYPSSLYVLALLMEETGLALKHIKAAHATSEKMLPEWKLKIENILGVPVKCHYGMVEKVNMSFQCSETDCYHESLEYGVTEFLMKEDRFQIIGTGFLNYTMPFIRYQMNDYAKLNKGRLLCKCGRGLPIIVEDFEGREDDILITKDGRYIPGVNFYPTFSEISGIKMFQIIQHTKDDIEIKIVPSDKFTEQSMALLKKSLTNRLGDMKLTIVFVDEIERSKKTGKIRCIINEYIKKET